jgi:hypothetical protein
MEAEGDGPYRGLSVFYGARAKRDRTIRKRILIERARETKRRQQKRMAICTNFAKAFLL